MCHRLILMKNHSQSPLVELAARVPGQSGQSWEQREGGVIEDLWMKFEIHENLAKLIEIF